LIIKQYPCFVNKKYSACLPGSAENNGKYGIFAKKSGIHGCSRMQWTPTPFVIAGPNRGGHCRALSASLTIKTALTISQAENRNA
jgi:hypothetical protein